MKLRIAALAAFFLVAACDLTDDQSKECKTFVACQKQLAAQGDSSINVEQLEAEYGKDGYCWTTAGLGETCNNLCKGTMQLFKENDARYATTPACQF